MNTDLLTEDLKKARASNESFWLMGQPEVEVRTLKDGTFQVEVHGFDYFHTTTGGSAVTVCNEFIKWALTHLKPKLVRAYFDACLKALCLGREDFAKPISRLLAINLVSELSQFGNPKKTRLANELKEYFHLAQTSMRPRLKELVRSIRLGFR